MMAEICHNPGPPFLTGINRKEVKYPFFKGADLNSFLFLFCDNMASLLGILFALIDVGRISRGGCWGPFMSCWDSQLPYLNAWDDMIFFKVLPGIGFAIMVGNFWYGWMAFKLAGYEKRTDVTALPYGINTPSGFLMAFNVMLPVAAVWGPYGSITDAAVWADKAWKAGASGCFLCGVLEISGAWLGPILAKIFTRAALFCPVGCVGFVWLGMVPFISVMAEPIKGALPLTLAFMGFYGARGKGLPFMGVPAFQNCSFIFIIAFGALTKWVGLGKYDPPVADMWATVEERASKYAFKNQMGAFVTLAGFADLGLSVSIVIPLAVQSFIETMENIELASQKGDTYNMREGMICDGFGTCIGALFGSIVPTTCYIGHSRHKMIGATAGYSFVNGLVYFVLCMSGLLPLLAAMLDDVSVAISLVAVGLMIIQDALELTHPRHIPAYCVGLFFVIADPWNFDMRDQGTLYCTRAIGRAQGLKNMWPGGGIMCSLMTTQVLCDLTDGKFLQGGIMACVCTIFSLLGIMHGNNALKPATGAPPYLGSGDGHWPLTGGPDTPGWMTGTVPSGGEGDLTITFMDGTYKTGYNEGYRFCIMYTIIAFYCFIHFGIQKMKPANLPEVPGKGFCPTAEDPDGLTKKTPPWKLGMYDGVTGEAKAKKATEEAAA